MFSYTVYMLLTGLIVRADGWGGSAKWKQISDHLNAYTCSILFAIITLLISQDILIALASAIAFISYRAPGFNGWENWLNMVIRGFWSPFIGFSALTLANGNYLFTLLAIPFSFCYALVYSGGYKWLPETIAGFNRHVYIEHASGWLFGLFTLIIILN